ncbi:MAG: SpaA isopeptide-forming pilin-related protein, partial [Eubacterium sp.]
NSLKRGSIEGIKVDTTTNIAVPHVVKGATIELFNSDNKSVGVTTTDGVGHYSFKDIPFGTYSIKETKAPAGYVLNSTPVTVSITENGQTVTADAIDNTMLKGNLSIKKVDQEDGNVLAGAAFSLEGTNSYGDRIQSNQTTGESGFANFENLPLGTYTLKETGAPTNYQPLGTTWTVNVTEKDNTAVVIVTGDLKTEDGHYIIENDRNKGSIIFTKIGMRANTEESVLAGATFGLYKDLECTKPVTDESGHARTAISNDKGEVVFDQMSFGTYYVKEIGHVTNYDVNTSVYKAVINGDGSFGTLEGTTDNKVLNNRSIGSVTLTKTDQDNGAVLAGATFTITDANGTVVMTQDSNSDGKVQFDHLYLGDQYTITETKAPIGYHLSSDAAANSKTFTLTEATPNINFGSWKNASNVGNITFGKVGEISEDASLTAPLAGVFFTLYTDPECTMISKTAESDGNGNVVFSDNRVGTYYIKETKAPANYRADATIYKAVIDNDGTFKGLYTLSDEATEIKTITNAAIRGSVSLKKADTLTGQALAGVTFGIFKEDAAEPFATAVTDENGMLSFGNLLMNVNYTVKEMATLNNYVLLNRAETFTVTADHTQKDLGTWNNDPTAFSVKKTDINGAPLENAVFGLYDGEVEIARATSNDTGDVTFTHLEKGKTYTVKELEAPEDYFVNPTVFKLTIDQEGIGTLTDNDQTITEVINEDKGSITLNKTAEETQKALSGAVFELKDANGKVVEKTTDENGQIIFTDLPMGTYTIREISAPNGYACSEDITTITLIKGSAQKPSISRTNRLSGFSFNKTVKYMESCSATPDKATALSDAIFGLYSDKNTTHKIAEATSDSFGQVSFTDLSVGTYYVKELSVTGDKIIMNTETYCATIDAYGHFDGLKTLSGDVLATNTVVNDVVRGTIEIKKVDEQHPEETIPDSTYGLYRKVGQNLNRMTGRSALQVTPIAAEEPGEILVATATTDANGVLKFEGILTGVQYTIRELTAPEGSQVSEKPIEITFKEDSKGNVVIESFDDGKGTAEVVDGKIVWYEPPTMAKIYKKDVNGNLLAGAKLRITNADGTPVTGLNDWVSADTDGQLIESILVEGKTYILVELEAPAGYQLAAPITFTMSDRKVGPNENYIQSWDMIDEVVVKPVDPDQPTNPD